MRSSAAAIAWEFRGRHRWGLAALAGYVFFVAAFKPLVLGPEYTVRLIPPDGTAAVVIVPFSILVMYFLAVFTFGFGGDLAARQSMYPARMFALPMKAAGLAGWPMLYGAVVMGSLWVATALLARWPWGVEVPLVWPALYAAAFLAWLQVLAWMPYGLRGLRVVLAVMWLTSINIVVATAVENQVSEPLMVAVLAPQLPLAYFCARFAVARARRGDVPDWRGMFARLGGMAHILPPRRDRLPSPARAQVWFEWRRHGWSLPVWVGVLLPFELAVLWVPGHPLVAHTLVVVLLTPPFIAAFAAATARKSIPPLGDTYGVTPFIATRPLTSAKLVAAKLTMAMWSTLAAWLLVLVAIPLGLTLSGTWPVVLEWAHEWMNVFGSPRALAILILGLAGLMASTWKQLVQGVCISLTGREWLIKASVLVRLSLLIVILPVAEWIIDGRRVGVLWHGLPWILAVWVGFKISAAVWITTRLNRDRLVPDRALVSGAACWLVVVLALHGLLVWLFSLPPSMAHYLLALVAIVAVPLVRPSAAPLALAWNRHRGARQDAAAESTADLARRRRVVGTVLVLIALPAILALVDATSFHVRNRSNESIVSSGEVREFLLYVPSSYDAARTTPLVISMHGGATWPAQQMHLSRWNLLAEENGFIVVYPAGTGFPKSWETFDPDARLEGDVRFVSELIDTLQAAYNIDPARIYANGMSNGGGMAFVLSCTLSDRIAAVGMVAPAQTLPPGWCANPTPVPMIAFQGDADPILLYEGGPMRDPINPNPPVFPAVRDFVARWAKRNRCGLSPLESEVVAEATRLEYQDCAGDAGVVLFTIHGGGHTWPGGEPLPEWFAGPTNHSIDATRLMWAFFQEHTLLR